MGKTRKHIISCLSPVVTLAPVVWLSFACTSDPKFNGPDGPGESGGEAYVSLRLNTAMDRVSPGTRSHNPDSGDPDYRIDTLRMVLYGPDDRVHYAFDFSIHTNYDQQAVDMFTEGEWVSAEYGHDLYSSSAWADDQPNFVTYARKVEKNDYRMLIILNSTGSGGGNDPVPSRSFANGITRSGITSTEQIMEITNVGQPLDLLYEPVHIDPERLFGGAETRSGRPGNNASIMMVNYQGLIPVSANQLGDSADEANLNPVFARVERYLAKVTVTTSNPDGSIEYTGSDNMQVREGGTWGLECTNKWTYWMRRLAPVIDPDGNPVNYSDLETPNYDPAVPPSRVNLYAWDPNFGLGTTQDPFLSENNGGTASARRAQFNYLAYAGNSFSPVVGNNFGDMEYALENTMSSEEQNDDVMTRAIVGIALSPDPMINAGDSYYEYVREGTQPEDAIYINGNDMYMYAWDPEQYIPDEPQFEGLAEVIAKLKADGFDWEDMNIGFSRYGLTYYHNGLHYYTVPIRHFGEFTGSAGDKAYGRYGIARNNHYVVKIKSVSGPGAPSLTDAPAYLSAEIGILPWLAHVQEGEVGEGVAPVRTYVTYKYYYEDGGTHRYLGARYDRSVSVDDAIDPAQMLNELKPQIPGGGDGYRDGTVMGTPPSNVNGDPARNVVEILYATGYR